MADNFGSMPLNSTLSLVQESQDSFQNEKDEGKVNLLNTEVDTGFGKEGGEFLTAKEIDAVEEQHISAIMDKAPYTVDWKLKLGIAG